MRRIAHIAIRIMLPAFVLAALPSCRLINSVLHDGEVVAKVGHHKLYRADIVSIVPPGTPAEDSLKLVQQYIDTWASALIIDEAATRSLSKKDLDVSGQLEQYRRALVKYRYEEQYVNERLDTLVSELEINSYYDEHQARFVLSYPIVKARFVRMRADSPRFDEIRKLMASSEDEDAGALEEMVATAAERYSDFGGRWIDITDLAGEFGTDYGTLLALMNNSSIQYLNGDGTVNYAYICDYVRSGSVPPVEYCEAAIKAIIINGRKQALISSLERDLLEEARSGGKLVTY